MLPIIKYSLSLKLNNLLLLLLFDKDSSKNY